MSQEARATPSWRTALRRDFTLPVLTAASELPPDDVVRAVDELWRQRLLRQTGDGYDFSHDFVREAAYAAVSPAQRWLLHRRLAEVLEELAGCKAMTWRHRSRSSTRSPATTAARRLVSARAADAIGGVSPSTRP